MIKTVIGLMSGTSMDGIDAALLETDGENHIVVKATASLSYAPTVKLALKAVEKFVAVDSHQPLSGMHAELSQLSTQLHIQTIEHLLEKSHYSPQQIDLIGYHGQTLCHRPQEKFTLQIGEPQLLANYFNIPVIFDFRSNDIKHGGQGAPLAPLYHQACMVQKNFPSLVMINCGGIANISVINGKKYEDIQAGFDTGPGNVLIDRFVREFTNNQEMFDQDGNYGLRGNVNAELIEQLFLQSCRCKALQRENLEIATATSSPRNDNYENYYLLPPPKSLDSNDIQFIPEIFQFIKNIEDGCATLAAFTAYTIAQSVDLIKTDIPKHWIVAGGGAKNPMIIKMLQDYLAPKIKDLQLHTADEAGFSSTYLEAELMAWLAVRSIRNLPLTVPQTTGVKEPMTGGKLFQPTH